MGFRKIVVNLKFRLPDYAPLRGKRNEGWNFAGLFFAYFLWASKRSSSIR